MQCRLPRAEAGLFSQLVLLHRPSSLFPDFLLTQLGSMMGTFNSTPPHFCTSSAKPLLKGKKKKKVQYLLALDQLGRGHIKTRDGTLESAFTYNQDLKQAHTPGTQWHFMVCWFTVCIPLTPAHPSIRPSLSHPPTPPSAHPSHTCPPLYLLGDAASHVCPHPSPSLLLSQRTESFSYSRPIPVAWPTCVALAPTPAPAAGLL